MENKLAKSLKRIKGIDILNKTNMQKSNKITPLTKAKVDNNQNTVEKQKRKEMYLKQGTN